MTVQTADMFHIYSITVKTLYHFNSSRDNYLIIELFNIVIKVYYRAIFVIININLDVKWKEDEKIPNYI